MRANSGFSGQRPRKKLARRSAAQDEQVVFFRFTTRLMEVHAFFAQLLVSVQLLCRPAPIHAQDGSSDERIFQ